MYRFPIEECAELACDIDIIEDKPSLGFLINVPT